MPFSSLMGGADNAEVYHIFFLQVRQVATSFNHFCCKFVFFLFFSSATDQQYGIRRQLEAAWTHQ